MNGPLDESVTLQEIVAIVSAKRVPLAPELAGYLTLEVAEQCASDDDDVDPAQIYVSDEGSVAVVRVRKAKDAEASAEATVRGLLARLLEASGSQTPALAACARSRRRGGAGDRARGRADSGQPFGRTSRLSTPRARSKARGAGRGPKRVAADLGARREGPDSRAARSAARSAGSC